MEFFDVIRKRRSCRKYTSTPVPKEVINNALDAALIAPNSSNIQPWEFYWVKSQPQKAELVKACLSQSAATTAQELVVAVARIDTWQRNRQLMLAHFATKSKIPKPLEDYYVKIVPFFYNPGFLSIYGFLKKLYLNVRGFFGPYMRGPTSKSQVFEVVAKTTALACENFMLSIYAQGFACCPMEGIDELRVRKLLGLNRNCHVAMVISVGEADPKGIYGEQVRFDRNLFVKEV